jgi:colanic acid/amylovoran biosynthesis glycosyltransferase
MLVYLIHTFPVYSSTFIINEVRVMREMGEQIRIFSVQRPGRGDYPPGYDSYAHETAYVFPLHPGKLLLRHVKCLLASPRHYVRALHSALTWGKMKLRNRCRTLVHFIEAVYVYPELKAAGCSHLHAHFLSGSASIALFLNQLHGIPYSLTAHGTDIFVEEVLLQEKMAHARFTRVGTEFNRRYLSGLPRQCKPPNISVIPFGIDSGLLAAAAPVCDACAPVRVLSVGRLVWQKAHELLLEAADKARRQGREFRVSIVGEGPERPKLEAVIRQRELGGVVELAGAKPEDDVHRAYTACHIFVLSSVSEGFGLVLVEAMAAGLAVIAPRLRGIPEIITDGVNGRLFETGNADGLASILVELLNDDAQRSRLGKEAIAQARRYENGALVREFRGVLRSHSRARET